MFKRIMAAGLAVAMLITQLPVSTYAADIETTELAQEVVVTGDEAVTSEAVQPSEIVEIPDSDVVVEIPSETAEEIVEVSMEETAAVEIVASEEVIATEVIASEEIAATEEVIATEEVVSTEETTPIEEIVEEQVSSEIQYENEVAATSLREDITRVFIVEDPVDNYINFEAKYYGYSSYSEFSDEPYNYYVKISETEDFAEYEQVWFNLNSGEYGNEYVVVKGGAYVGKANTTYYMDFVAYNYNEEVEISIATKEVTTKDEKVVTYDLQVAEPEYNYIDYTATLYGFNNSLEESITPGSHMLYISTTEDFSSLALDEYLNFSEVEVDGGIALEAYSSLFKGEANTTYYLKIVSYDYENGAVDCTPVVTVTTKDAKVYNLSFEVAEPEDNFIDISLTLENYESFTEFDAADLSYQVEISTYEDFSMVEERLYVSLYDIDDTDEGFLLSGTHSYDAMPNTTYYVRLIEVDYSNNDERTVIETVSVTTKDEKVYTGILTVDEPEYNTITYNVEMHNYDDWNEYYDRDYDLYVYISKTEDFADYESQYIDFYSKTENGEYILYTRYGYNFVGEPETTYYFKLIGVGYKETSDIIFDTAQVTTKAARTFDANLGVDEPNYNIVNYDVSLLGFEDWDDYRSINTDFYVYISEYEDFSEYTVRQYVSWYSDSEDGAYKLYREYTFEGKPNTTYYYKLVGVCGGVSTDYMTVVSTTKDELAITREFEVYEPTSNMITYKASLIGFENWNQYYGNSWEYYMYISKDAEFTDYDSVYVNDWNSRTNNGVFTIYSEKTYEAEANTTYYLKLVGEKDYEYYDFSDVISVTTKDSKVIDATLTVDEPANNMINYTVVLNGYDDWNEYNNMDIDYYVDIATDEQFSNYERNYLSWNSRTTNGVFTMTGKGSFFGEANTTYYVRLTSYNQNTYKESYPATTEVTTKDLLVYEGSLGVARTGAASAAFHVELKGLPANVINNKVYLCITEDANFETSDNRNNVWVEENDTDEYSFIVTRTYGIEPETTYYARLIFQTGNWDEFVVLGDTVTFTSQANVTYSEADIPDPVLREAILERTSDRILDKINLENITYLNTSRNSADEPAITDLTGIGLLTSLENLYLDYHMVSDISPIASLTSLRYCRIRDNRITTIPDLSAMTNLRNLDLDANYIPKTEFTTNNTNIPSYFRNDEWWLSETMYAQRTGTEGVSIVLADTYYDYGDAYALQVELANTYPLDSYTLSIYEGDTVLVEKAAPYENYSWNNVAEWLYTDLITEAGTRNLTFVAYANDVEATRVTKSITFKTENFYMKDGIQRYIPVDQYSFYVYFNLYGEADDISSITLNAKDGTNVIYLAERSCNSTNYDSRYEGIFETIIIETSNLRCDYYVNFRGNAPLGTYDLVVTMSDGSTITKENYLTVTSDPLLKSVYSADYPSEWESGYQYIELGGQGIDWSKVYPVITDFNGNELTTLVNYKITHEDSAVYKVKLIDGMSWEKNMLVKFVNNTGYSIYNEDYVYEWYMRNSVDVYYAEYNWVNKTVAVRTSNMADGEYTWELMADYESEVIATAKATLTNGVAHIQFVDTNGNVFDFLEAGDNSFYVVAYQGTDMVLRGSYMYLRIYDVYAADDYIKNLDNIMFPIVNPGSVFNRSIGMSKSVVVASDSLSAVLKTADGEVITTGRAYATDAGDYTYIQFNFTNVSLSNETYYGVEILKGETSLGTATYIILDPAQPYYQYTDYGTDYDTQTVELFLYGEFPTDMDLSKITIQVMDEEGTELANCALQNARFEDDGYIIIGSINLGTQWDTLKANYSWLYWKPYYNGQEIKYAYLQDAVNEFYIGGTGAVVEDRTYIFTKYTKYGDYRVRQSYGFYSLPNANVTVNVYYPYDTDALKTFTACTNAEGRYEFTTNDFAGLSINESFARYDIVLTDATGKFLASSTEVLLKGTETASVIEHMIFNKYEMSLGAEQSETLLVAVRPEVYYDYIVWASSDTSVATVDQEGKVTAVGNGTATITASVEGKTISCTVTVSGYAEEVGESTFTYDDAGRIVYVDGNGNIDTTATGLMQCDIAGNAWIYMNEGVFDSTKFDFVEFGGGQFFVVNGVLASDISGLQLFGDAFYFLAYGQLQDYTGLALYDGEFFYVKNGILAVDYNGLLDFDGSTFLIAAGRIVGDYTGLYNDALTGKWYYIVNGQVQTYYTGLVMYDGAWFYLVNGVLASDYVGYVDYDGSQFYVQNGQVVL